MKPPVHQQLSDQKTKDSENRHFVCTVQKMWSSHPQTPGTSLDLVCHVSHTGRYVSWSSHEATQERTRMRRWEMYGGRTEDKADGGMLGVGMCGTEFSARLSRLRRHRRYLLAPAVYGVGLRLFCREPRNMEVICFVEHVYCTMSPRKGLRILDDRIKHIGTRWRTGSTL